VAAVDQLFGQLLVLRQGRVAAEISESGMSPHRILDHYHASV
jgi:hypothetical protein